MPRRGFLELPLTPSGVSFGRAGNEGAVPLLPLSRRAIWLLDVVLVAWIALWLLLAVRLHDDIRALTGLSDGAVAAGRALTTTADERDSAQLGERVGGEVEALERDVRDAARRATRAGRQSRAEIREYARLVGAIVAVGPTLPPLLLYLPLRLGWARDRRRVKAALRANDPELRHYLAGRRLRRADPATFAGATTAGALDAAAVERLAAEELRRLGLRPRA